VAITAPPVTGKDKEVVSEVHDTMQLHEEEGGIEGLTDGVESLRRVVGGTVHSDGGGGMRLPTVRQFSRDEVWLGSSSRLARLCFDARREMRWI
jgi:hypothetical protein